MWCSLKKIIVTFFNIFYLCATSSSYCKQKHTHNAHGILSRRNTKMVLKKIKETLERRKQSVCHFAARAERTHNLSKIFFKYFFSSSSKNRPCYYALRGAAAAPDDIKSTHTQTCMHAYTERHNVCGGGETFASECVCVDVGSSGDDYLRSSQMHSTAHRERTRVEERKRALCVCVWHWHGTFAVWCGGGVTTTMRCGKSCDRSPFPFGGRSFAVCGFVLTASSRLQFFTTTTARRNMKIMAAKFWEFVVVVVVD